MLFLHRFCVACRRLLPEELTNPVLTFTRMESKWVKKNHKHKVTPVQEEEVYALCETCAEKMEELIESQLKKGAKVL